MTPKCLSKHTHTDIYALNKEVLKVIALNMEQYRKETGLSYTKLSKVVGCSQMTLFKIGKGQLDYCSLSLLSCIAKACNASLLGWLSGSDGNAPFGPDKP